MRSIIYLFIMLQVALLSSIYSFESVHTDFFREERLYVVAEDVIITQEGIHYKNGDHPVQIKALFSDEQGLFIVMPIRKKEDTITDCCKNGHPIYHWEGGCMGCAHLWCPYRCKHSSPWAHK